MSSNLYEQAIAEAKQLRDMAEQNAKNKIIEAVTPRIKALIEAQIMGEQDEPVEDELTGIDIAMMADDEDEELPPSVVDQPLPPPMPEDELLEPPVPEYEMSDDEDEVENTSVTVNAQGDVNISVAEGRGRNRGLRKNTRSTVMSGKVNLKEAFNSIRRQAKRMDAMLQGLQFNKLNEKQRTLIKKAYQDLLSEALLMKRLLLKEGANKQLTTSYKNMIKEIKEMTRRSSAIFRRLFEIDETDERYNEIDVYEEDEELEGGDEDLGGGEEAAAEDVDVDAASTALEDLGAALGLEVEVGVEGEEGEEGEELGGEEAEEEEIDLGEFDRFSEGDDDEAEATDEGDDDDAKATDEVYEIDENILRREIRRLRKLREGEGVDPGVLDNFGGGDDEGDMFVDVDEDDLLNALADELGDAPTPTVENRRRRGRAQRRNSASRTRRSTARLQTENRKLQKQLKEMNLFNAKLLYVNKLMQNRNVTQKQQRAIVEALDNAKTVREAKFLYQGLAKSLVKRSRKINESAGSRKLLSSASKSTRSGSPTISEDTVAARWATLAGIRK
jgi:hypothetical protein